MTKFIIKSLFIFTLSQSFFIHASTITSPYLSDPGFSTHPGEGPWNFNGNWRDNGANSNAVFDAKQDGNNPTMGYQSLQQNVDPKTVNAFTSDPNYDASTTRLTGFDTDNVSHFHSVVALGNLGTNYDYTMFWEIDVITTGGDYRLKSNDIDLQAIPNNTTINSGDEWTAWTWQTGGFLGDIADASGGGVPFQDISEIRTKLFVRVIDAHDGTGTVFYLADDVSISATATTIPEPSTLGLLLLTGVFFIRRFK